MTERTRRGVPQLIELPEKVAFTTAMPLLAAPLLLLSPAYQNSPVFSLTAVSGSLSHSQFATVGGAPPSVKLCAPSVE